MCPHPGKCLLLCSDGGLEAVIDRAGGWVEAARPADVYSTDEPRAAYHARIAFCMDIHTEVRSWLAHGRMGRMGGAACSASRKAGMSGRYERRLRRAHASPHLHSTANRDALTPTGALTPWCTCAQAIRAMRYEGSAAQRGYEDANVLKERQEQVRRFLGFPQVLLVWG